ncbi:ImmA/IrrE family metallo-endopeptidase [bacterium BMS3Abin03]|nr:ImmA/IrrE family metallo-endopeptidase [bacterium BMS3Abin03]
MFDRELENRKIEKYSKIKNYFKTINYDKHGVPYLSWENIETITEQFLHIYYPILLRTPQSTPLLKITKSLVENSKLNIDFSRSLGTGRNERILGKTIFNQKLILLDKSLTPEDPQFYFVLAHELGHVFLHTKRKIIDDHKKYVNFSKDKAKHFFIKPHTDMSVRNKIEWQANAFSAAVLMPRNTFKQALIKIQKELGINRNVGIIYLDNNDYSKGMFNNIIHRLSNLYHCSFPAIKYRLNNLNLVVDISKSKPSYFNLGNILDQIIKENTI